MPEHLHATHEAVRADTDVERQQTPQEKVISDETQTPVASQAASIAKALDWDGPDDLENPYNWSVWQRVFHSAMPALYCFVL